MIKWLDQYNVGNERIDFQHHIFLGLISEFQEMRKSNFNDKMLREIVEEICMYARYHFLSEENIMRNHGYPDYLIHKKHHLTLIDELNNQSMGMQIGAVSAKQIEEFLVDWFVAHTSNEDKLLANYIRKTTELEPPVSST
jgi:hemerythrin